MIQFRIGVLNYFFQLWLFEQRDIYEPYENLIISFSIIFVRTHLCDKWARHQYCSRDILNCFPKWSNDIGLNSELVSFKTTSGNMTEVVQGPAERWRSNRDQAQQKLIVRFFDFCKISIVSDYASYHKLWFEIFMQN